MLIFGRRCSIPLTICFISMHILILMNMKHDILIAKCISIMFILITENTGHESSRLHHKFPVILRGHNCMLLAHRS